MIEKCDGIKVHEKGCKEYIPDVDYSAGIGIKFNNGAMNIYTTKSPFCDVNMQVPILLKNWQSEPGVTYLRVTGEDVEKIRQLWLSYKKWIAGQTAWTREDCPLPGWPEYYYDENSCSRQWK